jgi:hypothetical protein
MFASLRPCAVALEPEDVWQDEKTHFDDVCGSP